MHTCLECKTVHKDIYELTRHKEKEHEKSIFKCNLCVFSSKNESEYNIHLSGHEQAMYTCEVCEMKGKSQGEIDDHIQRTHVKEMFQHCVKRNEGIKTGRQNQNRAAKSAKVFSYAERQTNGCCVYWNRGTCSYGELCRFFHEDTPECRYQDRCFRKSTCKFYGYLTPIGIILN